MNNLAANQLKPQLTKSQLAKHCATVHDCLANVVKSYTSFFFSLDTSDHSNITAQ